MKELLKYQCEFCKTVFTDKEKCETCEKNHKIKPKITEKIYTPFISDNRGYPLRLKVTFEDGEIINYVKT